MNSSLIQNKKTLMQNLISALAQDNSLDKIIVNRKGVKVDVGLINQYKLHNIIPNKWFDWVNRVDSPIMIIGQDWGPYSALLKYIDDYKIENKTKDFDYDKFLFKTLSSRTEKFIINSLAKNFHQTFNREISMQEWNLFFFTVAVLLTRKGNLFRGNTNFQPQLSLNHSYSYVSKQIDIVNPKIIMPLGGMAWEVVSKKFELDNLGKTITDVINKLPQRKYLKVKDTFIIPNFHPASYVDPKIIDGQFNKIWEIVKLEKILS